MKADFDNLQIDIINGVIDREVEWADDPTDDIQEAWSRVQDLARKGIVAEKYTKEWEQK